MTFSRPSVTGQMPQWDSHWLGPRGPPALLILLLRELDGPLGLSVLSQDPGVQWEPVILRTPAAPRCLASMARTYGLVLIPVSDGEISHEPAFLKTLFFRNCSYKFADRAHLV